ncbi:predicted protein [Cyanophage PSS2]|uniref:hypothetical protein n=1 Tax=Cyanophage PSS2 TaxID=658401 RepID=UPI0001B0403F|nr:hypothetical protein PSS2_gp104 [Cyanophage PSS2]ACT65666.1 hypothetical protein [Cyanophage PSS2]ACY75806.1 predicted protein [Cyanophage PSS2]
MAYEVEGDGVMGSVVSDRDLNLLILVLKVTVRGVRGQQGKPVRLDTYIFGKAVLVNIRTGRFV